MRRNLVVLPFLQVVLICLITSVCTYAQGQGYATSDCFHRHVTRVPPENDDPDHQPSCTQWTMDVETYCHSCGEGSFRNVPKWSKGMLSSKTRAGVEQQREKDIKFDKSWAKWIGRAYVPGKYGPPTCVDCSISANPGKRWPLAENLVIDKARTLADNLEARLQQAATQFIFASEHLNPYAGVGTGVSDWGLALSNLIRDQRRLREETNRVLAINDETMGNIGSFSRDIEQDDLQYKRTYDALPQSVKAILAKSDSDSGSADSSSDADAGFNPKEMAQAFRAAAEAMKSAADMADDAGESAEKPCLQSWSRFFSCWADRLESGSSAACPKPSCDLGVEGYADLMKYVEEEMTKQHPPNRKPDN